MRCPECQSEMANMGPDELDQSGWTYLPAERWECPKCCDAGLCTHVFVRTGEPCRTRPLPAGCRTEE